MEKQLENIIESAAQMVVSGEATPENAIEMAINRDNDLITKYYDALMDTRLDIEFKGENYQRVEAFGKHIYNKLNN
jgi:hypothetical protein